MEPHVCLCHWFHPLMLHKNMSLCVCYTVSCVTSTNHCLCCTCVTQVLVFAAYTPCMLNTRRPLEHSRCFGRNTGQHLSGSRAVAPVLLLASPCMQTSSSIQHHSCHVWQTTVCSRCVVFFATRCLHTLEPSNVREGRSPAASLNCYGCLPWALLCRRQGSGRSHGCMIVHQIPLQVR